MGYSCGAWAPTVAPPPGLGVPGPAGHHSCSVHFLWLVACNALPAWVGKPRCATPGPTDPHSLAKRGRVVGRLIFNGYSTVMMGMVGRHRLSTVQLLRVQYDLFTKATAGKHFRHTEISSPLARLLHFAM